MSDCKVVLNNMVDKAKIKDVLLWTVYTNVIEHKNIGYGNVVDLFVNKRCQNLTFRDYFFLQRIFGIYGAIFRSVNLNDVLNYANGIEQISKNEKHLLLRNINVFYSENRLLHSSNNFINLYRSGKVVFSEFEKHLVYEDF